MTENCVPIVCYLVGGINSYAVLSATFIHRDHPCANEILTNPLILFFLSRRLVVIAATLNYSQTSEKLANRRTLILISPEISLAV